MQPFGILIWPLAIMSMLAIIVHNLKIRNQESLRYVVQLQLYRSTFIKSECNNIFLISCEECLFFNSLKFSM